MDSLLLPSDLYWDSKTDTNTHTLSALSNDFCLFDDLDINGFDNTDLTTDVTMIQNDNELLEHGTIFKDNLLLPVLDIEVSKDNGCYSSERNADGACLQYSKSQLSSDASSYCFGNVALSTFTQLTPPSSPPLNFCLPVTQVFSLSLAPQGIQTLPDTVSEQNNAGGYHQNIETSAVPLSVLSQASYNNDSTAFSSPCATAGTLSDDELAREIQIVDDILKTAANKFFDDSASQTSVSVTSHGDYTTTDDEWLPPSSPSDNSSLAEPVIVQEASKSPAKKQRQRAGGRSSEDRKVRKKEQNKNAATRYRQKKKLEMESILSEESQLLKRNEYLTRQLKERTNELKYLKKLIREFYRDKPPLVPEQKSS